MSDTSSDFFFLYIFQPCGRKSIALAKSAIANRNSMELKARVLTITPRYFD